MGHKLRCTAASRSLGSPQTLSKPHTGTSALQLPWNGIFFSKTVRNYSWASPHSRRTGGFAQSCLQTMMREEILSPSVRIKPFLEKCNYR